MRRTILLVVGLVVALMGVLWALQGAYVIPATFMRGEEWIAIGLGVAAAGFVLVILGLRVPKRASEPSAPESVE